MSQAKPVLVLDFDGVILSLDIDWPGLRQEISAALEIKIDTFASFFEENFGKSDFERVSELAKKVEFSAAEKAAPYPDVQPALELLRTREIKTYIASMQSIDVLNFFLQKQGISSYFVQVWGRESGGSKRFQLEQIKKIEQQDSHGLEPKFVLIDDAKRNTVLASELGYAPILFKRDSNGISLVNVVKSVIEKSDSYAQGQ